MSDQRKKLSDKWVNCYWHETTPTNVEQISFHSGKCTANVAVNKNIKLRTNQSGLMSGRWTPQSRRTFQFVKHKGKKCRTERREQRKRERKTVPRTCRVAASEKQNTYWRFPSPWEPMMLFVQESEGTNSSERDASEEDPLCIIGSSDRIIAFAGCSHDRHFR